MEQSQYTLPGVMNFLRTEWQRKEQTRIEWEVERAEMRSRITRLEAENLELRRERDKIQRHLDILYGQKRSSSVAKSHRENVTTNGAASGKQTSNVAATEEKENETTRSNTDSPKTKTKSEAEESAGVQTDSKTISTAATNVCEFEFLDSNTGEASEELMKTVSESQNYLRECVADIKHILRESGALQNDAEALVSPHTGFCTNHVTLANFKGAALAVAVLSPSRVVAGTEDGELLTWTEGQSNFQKFGGDIGTEPVSCMAVSHLCQRIIAGVGSSLQMYDTQEIPQLICTHQLDSSPIVCITASSNCDLISVIQANGVASIWGIGKDFEKMREVATGVRVCDFVADTDEINLILARNADPTDLESPESNLLLVDALSGRTLTKIVFSSTAGISAILTTQDTIILGTETGDLRVLGLARGETLAEVTAAHRGEITSLSLVPNKSVMSTSIDGRVSVWSLPSLHWSGRMFSHDSGYGALCSSSCLTEETVAVGGGDSIIRVYRK